MMAVENTSLQLLETRRQRSTDRASRFSIKVCKRSMKVQVQLPDALVRKTPGKVLTARAQSGRLAIPVL